MTSTRLQAGRRPHVDDVVVDEEVAAFDERDAHLAREEGVLEIGGVADARRQHDECRIGDVRRRQRTQRRQQRLSVVRDRADLVAIEETRHHALGHLAVGEHVRHAARHAQVVFEDDEPAVFQADEIAPRHRHVDVAVHADAAHLTAIVLAAVEQLARHDALGEDAALVVDVLQEQVDGRQALRQAVDERLPLGGGDDPRQEIERKDTLGAFFVAVDGEGDALGEERLVGLDLSQPELARRRHAELVEKGTVWLPGITGGVEHLVVAGAGVIAGKQLTCRRHRRRRRAHGTHGSSGARFRH